MRSSRQFLRIAAYLESVTLIMLLANLATVHTEVVSSLVGPVHGCAYLFVIIATLGEPRATRKAKATSLLPGIGGLLVLRQLATRADTREPDRHTTAP